MTVQTAHAQGLTDLSTLPSVGTVVRPGDLRDHLTSATPLAGLLGGRAVTVTPALDIQELATDNAFNGGSNARRGAEFITTIQPSVSIAAQTRRFEGNLTYDPSINIYARNSNQSYVGQNFSGTGLATLVPDLLFLDVRGFAAVQSTSGGYGPNTTTALNRQNQTQSTSFSVSPYISHRFGGTGTVEAGYTLSYSANSNVTGVTSNTSNPQFSAGQFGLLTPNQTAPNSNYVSNEEHASFTTGEDFGRLNHRVAVSATQYSGNGVYQGAYRSLETYDLAYAASRFVTLLGEIGHESIHYGGVPPVRIDDAVWNVGAKLAPNADSSLTLTYGHHDGADAATFDGRYDATARLRLYARYTEGLSTSAEDTSNALAAVDTTQPGGLFDRSNGAPLSLTDNFFGVQNNLYRLRRFSSTASLVYDRDVFSLTATRESRHVISSASAGVPGISDKATYGSVSWSHELGPDLQSSAFVQYGTYTTLNPGPGSASGNDSFVASVSLSYTLSATVRTTAQYSYSKNEASVQGQASTQNVVLLGVHKQF